MYNGIGLQTPRGSGTTGHVQASKFLSKPWPSPSSCSPSALGGMRKPNRDIIEHERKRQVDLRLLVLREALEEQGYTEAEIEACVDKARKATEAETASTTVEVDEGRPPLQHKGYGD
ncbi:Serine/arginine repetitive matrix protein 2 [Zea mays]|uniref:Serine/arginine repetitive matrix protein 2 n=1 Tax=Zea mays TaxID=4577 RepID=A0A3L6DNL3_MAIZE|nr:Serine/arginine repetitive matrix protein 2 [Zea mays]